MRGKSRILRSIAAVTVFFFFWNTATAYSLPVLGLLPAKLGTVQSTPEHIPSQSTDKTVLLLLNAHTSSDAQKNIAEMLEFFQAQGIDLIGLEGADDRIDGEIFRRFPHKESLAKAAWQMVKDGKLTGAEYFYVTAEKIPAFYGIEDKALYHENKNAFVATTQLREKLAVTLEKVSNAAAELKNKIYSKKLKNFDSLVTRHKNQDTSFLDYFSQLNEASDDADIAIPTYPNVYALSKAVEKEKTLNQKKVAKDIEKIKKTLPKDAIREDIFSMAGKNDLESRNKDENEDVLYIYKKLYTYFSGLVNPNVGAGSSRPFEKGAETAPLQLNDFKHFKRYYEWLEAVTAVKQASLFEELDALVVQIYSRIAKSDKEKTLLEINRSFETFQQKLAIQLTQKDWARVKAIKVPGTFFVPGTFSELGDRAPQISPEELLLIEQANAQASQFYEVAEKRNVIFTDKIINQMETSQKNVSVVVVGGFHEAGLRAALEAKGVHTAVITPKMKDAISDIPYIERMTGKPTQLEKIITEAMSALEREIVISGNAPDEMRRNAAVELVTASVLERLWNTDPARREQVADELSRSISRIIPGVQLGLQKPVIPDDCEGSEKCLQIPVVINGKQIGLSLKQNGASKTFSIERAKAGALHESPVQQPSEGAIYELPVPVNENPIFPGAKRSLFAGHLGAAAAVVISRSEVRTVTVTREENVTMITFEIGRA